ncbi:alpha/beta hydrolase family protein [Undibacterium umbellatum]|nr:alpha/beta fold hydrolase [Undibacterium umbellatum]
MQNQAPFSPAAMIETVNGTRQQVVARDGQVLVTHRYDPTGPVRGVVVIAPAMAVAQVFYTSFAGFLAQQGFRVWTFDYRGIGASLQGSMRHVKTDLSEWIEKDYDAVLCAAGDYDPTLPLFAIGHSFGGQVAPLLPSRQRLSGLITVASGSGAMRHNTPNTRRRAPLLWYVLAPILCRLFGFFPGARIGVIGDVPSGAILQWRRWCLTPEYLLTGEPGAREAYATAAYPVLGLAFNDDELLLENGVRLLHDAYLVQPADFRLIEVSKLGLKKIGHFGFFKRQSELLLWPMVTTWLTQKMQHDQECKA